MKGALLYLFTTKLKNQFNLLLKSPGKLLYLACILLFVALALFGGKSGKTQLAYRDIGELTAGITVFYTAMFVLIANRGFHDGASMFSLSDVQLLFPSPIGARKILMYGLFQQIGTSLLLGFFLVFQFSWMRQLFGIGVGDLLCILLGYGLTVFLANVTAMVLYSLTSADLRRKRIAKALFYSILGVFALYILFCALDSNQMLQKAVLAINSGFARLMPVSGWLSGAVSGILVPSTLGVFTGFSLAAAYCLLLICVIAFQTQDYYEDVIKSAEVTRSAITARKEGVIAESAPTNVKIGKTGIGRGWGASAFFYKHLVEDRRSRVWIVSKANLSMVVIGIVFAVFMKKTGLMAVFAFSTYLQMFSILYGRFNRELTKPFIYMIPEPPFKKLLYSLAQTLPSATVEAILLFLPVTFIISLSPSEALCCIFARASFALLFTAGNIVLERLWGGTSSRGLVVFLYIILLVVLALPGIILSTTLIISGFILFSANITALLALCVANIPVSLLAFYLCRDMLQYAELNYR